MEGKLITTGIDGIIVNSDVFSNAHQEWFDLWAKRLNMPELREYAGKSQKEYWEGVKKAMEAYFGQFSKYEGTVNTMARLEYQMMALHCADELLKKDELVLQDHESCALIFKTLKARGRHEFCLVTSSPTEVIRPLLEMINCHDLYDYIYTSRLDEKPSTKKVYERMLKDTTRKKPAVHIAAGLSGIETGLKFKVPTILTLWDNGDSRYKEVEDAKERAMFSTRSTFELRSQLDVLLNL
jgi:phosphoglycolate phosphatase-like HAD superfamily hydrolase